MARRPPARGGGKGEGDPTLFDAAARRDPALRKTVPLAERMRPRALSDLAGQEHLLGEGKLLARAIAADRVPSMILWGPPGSGKTTLARVIAETTNARFVPVFGAWRMLRSATIVPAIVGPTVLVLGLVEAHTGAIGLWPFLPLFVLQIASNSFVGANAQALALQRYPHMAGTASSLMGVMQFGLGALFGAAVVQAFAAGS